MHLLTSGLTRRMQRTPRSRLDCILFTTGAGSVILVVDRFTRMTSPTPTDFTVRFSTEVARVLECDDVTGRIQFTLDAGAKGDRSICLEHHPSDWPRGPRYDLAFRRAKEYLESCGYEVEIYGA